LARPGSWFTPTFEDVVGLLAQQLSRTAVTELTGIAWGDRRQHRRANDALTEVRRDEARKLEPSERPALKGTRWILLKRRKRLNAEQEASLAAVKHTNASGYRASLLKESFSDVFTAASGEDAEQRLREWPAWASRSLPHLPARAP
jgi:transposase